MLPPEEWLKEYVRRRPVVLKHDDQEYAREFDRGTLLRKFGNLEVLSGSPEELTLGEHSVASTLRDLLTNMRGKDFDAAISMHDEAFFMQVTTQKFLLSSFLMFT